MDIVIILTDTIWQKPLTIILIHYPSVHESMAVAILMKTATNALIYKKLLKLSQRSLIQIRQQKNAQMDIINLLLNDVQKIDDVTFGLIFCIIVPIQTLITGYLLWTYLGFASIAGMILLFLLIPVQAMVNKFANNYRFVLYCFFSYLWFFKNFYKQ